VWLLRYHLVYYDPLPSLFEQQRPLVQELRSELYIFGCAKPMVSPTLSAVTTGPDLPWIAQNKGLSEDECFRLFVSPPTWCISGLRPRQSLTWRASAKLAVPLLESPRKVSHRHGAVSEPGVIYSLTSPGGWRWVRVAQTPSRCSTVPQPAHLSAGRGPGEVRADQRGGVSTAGWREGRVRDGLLETFLP
jgi:allophanate hydrolase subunit 1